MSSAALECAVGSRARRSSRWWWDRGILVGALLVATLLAWQQLGHMQIQMQMRAGESFPLLLELWSVMMIAMMLPAASPMIMMFAAISSRNSGAALVRTSLFIAAYLGVWSVASAAGALAQAAMYAVTAHGNVLSSSFFAAAALLGAGLWQLTPLKHACLRRCRTPLGFLITAWRPGARGAFVMGARHGADCVRCCWALMAVMLGLGTMKLAVMAILTVLMVAEKVAPNGHRIGRAAALPLFACGVWQIVRLT
jgi:predicted metal-binding membrane protein